MLCIHSDLKIDRTVNLDIWGSYHLDYPGNTATACFWALRNVSQPVCVGQLWMYIYIYISGWRFGTYFVFSYIGNNNPNWLSYVSEGLVYHQPVHIYDILIQPKVGFMAGTSSDGCSFWKGRWLHWMDFSNLTWGIRSNSFCMRFSRINQSPGGRKNQENLVHQLVKILFSWLKPSTCLLSKFIFLSRGPRVFLMLGSILLFFGLHYIYDHFVWPKSR